MDGQHALPSAQPPLIPWHGTPAWMLVVSDTVVDSDANGELGLDLELELKLMPSCLGNEIT
jgi:hypothetical protein